VKKREKIGKTSGKKETKISGLEERKSGLARRAGLLRRSPRRYETDDAPPPAVRYNKLLFLKGGCSGGCSGGAASELLLQQRVYRRRLSRLVAGKCSEPFALSRAYQLVRRGERESERELRVGGGGVVGCGFSPYLPLLPPPLLLLLASSARHAHAAAARRRR